MSNLSVPVGEGQRPLNDRLDAQKTQTAMDQGRFYHPNYAIENFINVLDDSGTGDSFKTLNDPTFTGFKMFFHFDATSGLFADEEYVDSALAYLKRIGQTDRYNLLKRFIHTLSRTNSIAPWLFQNIEGLQEVYAEPYEEIYKKHQITIHCLETVDNKIGSLVQMYKSIAYDHHSRKWILPINLRRFSMSIFVYDYSFFNDMDAQSLDFLQTIENTDVTKLNHTLFDLGYCEFNPASGSTFFDSVSNNRNDANVNNLTIDFEQYDISGLFKSLLGTGSIGSKALASLAITNVNGEAPDNSFFSKRNLLDRLSTDIIKDKIDDALDTEKWKTKLQDFGTNVASDLIQNIRGSISSLFLGNVYGFDTANVINSGQRSITSTLSSTSSIPSLKANSDIQSNQGNVNS